MNEADAKTKWCPAVRVIPHEQTMGDPALINNRGRTNSCGNWVQGTRCIGSECMAWRAYDDESGYCGLAGAPINDFRGEVK